MLTVFLDGLFLPVGSLSTFPTITACLRLSIGIHRNACCPTCRIHAYRWTFPTNRKNLLWQNSIFSQDESTFYRAPAVACFPVSGQSMLGSFPICSIIPNPLSRCFIPNAVLCRKGANGRISDLHSRKGETIRKLKPQNKSHGRANKERRNAYHPCFG